MENPVILWDEKTGAECPKCHERATGYESELGPEGFRTTFRPCGHTANVIIALGEA